MRKIKVASSCASIALLLSMSGCASMESGQDFDMGKAQAFPYGKTSRADIIATLGQPTSTGSSAEGTSISYTYTKSGMGGLKNVAAMYGIGSMRTKTTLKTCTYTFDAHDKLKNAQCSETNQ